MICSKCGNSISKDDEYCPKCGHRIADEEHCYEVGDVRNSTIALLNSGLFGAVCWCLVGFVVCIVIGWFIPLNLENYAEALRRLNAPENISSIFDVSDTTGRMQIIKILLMFVVALPVFISASGLFNLRAYAKGTSIQNGLDLVKAGIKIGIIYSSVLALGSVGIGVVLIVFGGYGDRTSLAWTIPAFLMTMLFIGVALMLLVKMLRFAQGIKEAVMNDDLAEKPSEFVRIASVAIGVVGVFVGIGVLTLTFDITTGMSLILWSLVHIFIGILVSKVQNIDRQFYSGLYDSIYKSVPSESKRWFCSRCGRELLGGEICTCTSKRYIPPSSECKVKGRLISTVPQSPEVSVYSPKDLGDNVFKKAKNII